MFDGNGNGSDLEKRWVFKCMILILDIRIDVKKKEVI